MRATYEDLLRAARRTAVDLHREVHSDQAELAAGWQAVLVAARRHLRWLRGDLTSFDASKRIVVRSGAPMPRLAQAIGAGADLLASQDPSTAAALDDRDDLAAARAEVAAVVLIAGRVVLRDLRISKQSPGYRRVTKVMAELEVLAQSDRRRTGLGVLGGLAIGAPQDGVDDVSLLARCAGRWERGHQSIPPLTLLSRDLRSMTAQLRTVCGYTWHLADHLLAMTAALGLGALLELDLRTMKVALRTFDDGAMRVARCWQRRVSDVSGRSNTAGEVAFLELVRIFDRVVRRDGALLAPSELVPTPQAAAALLDAMDELVYSADRVVRMQQQAVAGLIVEGRLFVPRHELAKRDPRYLRRPGAGSRSPQVRWVRTSRADCFDELTDALQWSVDHLSVAADLARRMAGTCHQSRPYGAARNPVMPPPFVDVRKKADRFVADSTGSGNPGQEPVGPGR
ncbi:hypothetical protein EV646_1239 [Kribbella antiqua]|uniref:Uncharacterized protein n=1 Tax=Kribbella antiqua TaxID=2512217 RepID=A0A4R2I135_9ACTN|nr:hypothetical protein [Kribbella antiqua]TCO37622.1 hypothetical protein EV646_1239 [Kribbella antiqua]